MRNVTTNIGNQRIAGGFFVPHRCHGSTDQGQVFRRAGPNRRGLETAPTRMPGPTSAPNRSMAGQRSFRKAIGTVLGLLFVLAFVAGFSWSAQVTMEAANRCLPAVMQSQYGYSAASAQAQVQDMLTALVPNRPSK